MRISSKIAIVGGIPITIAAAIALIAWLLLNEGERARDGAVVAGTIYRDLLVAMAARDEYINARPSSRPAHAARFTELAGQARNGLEVLRNVARDSAHRQATDAARDALERYIERMGQFVAVTTRNDGLISDMAVRASSLITLTDQARQRQRKSNADIITSLTEGDRRLRATREIVDKAHELRTAISEVELQEAVFTGPSMNEELGRDAQRQLVFSTARVKNAAADLGLALRQAGRDAEADELSQLQRLYEADVTSFGGTAARDLPTGAAKRRDLAVWADRLLKVNSSEQRTLHDEVAQLLTYSVQAGETEQATQNIAILTLKLGQRTGEALANRDPSAAEALLLESRALAETVASLPISPLIQSEMIDAIEQWSKALETTIDGLRNQNEMIADMDAAARTMVEGARSLNDLFTGEANRIGDSIRKILIFGAATGLLLGCVTAYVVARSMTRPLGRLQQGMLELAADPLGGRLPDSERRDELGDMTRAANFFVTEIGRREQALRQAKNRADAALAELRQTQADLIQAEKLASLGQLVAGVAHEINTPLGISLTTATLLGDEVDRFSAAAANGQLPRSVFVRFVERMSEGSKLLFTNLTRAADLVHSFKQVAADQASGERRRFEMKTWLGDLLTSLGPALRKTSHQIHVECRPDLMIDTYPGALAQVVTNLLMNALAHAYDEGVSGRMVVQITEPAKDTVRIVFSDDGKGIPPHHIGKVFDPFFTTGRGRGRTGLGLHIVYNLVTSKLHGKIDIDSTPGKGTRFTIDLPVTVPETPPERLVTSA